jgi:preprotein translocase subunit SecA
MIHAALSLPRTPAALPVPGPLAGRYPQRAESHAPWLVPGLARLASRWLACYRPAPDIDAIREAQRRWTHDDATRFAAELQDLRACLARDGLDGTRRHEALGCVSAAMLRVLGRDPFDTQLHGATVLLDDQLAEMATGEGKTLAVALAAGVAALAGIPVHVMTANDYLATRDADLLGPLFAALGLSTGLVTALTAPEARRVAYACDITYCTAREVAFDHLRDRLHLHPRGSDLRQRAQALAGTPPPPLLLRGLCMALVDEADSLLIDEATMPLVLAEPVEDPAHRAACFQAMALARSLLPGRDVQLDETSHAVHWSAEGLALLESQAQGAGAALNQRHQRDLVDAALVALHLLQRDRHYLVRDDAVQLLDGVTGRTAPGRVWTRGLQTAVELKEGCRISPATRTSAQTTYQRFFARYLRLAGTSGTLAECRDELASVYGKQVAVVPLRRPCLRQNAPPRVFADALARRQAISARASELSRSGRPVLIGVDSVAAARTLSDTLTAAGLEHRVLDARHDADEAAIVARAGQAGAVTVATAMAGRGTDIELGPGVVARGGLHVINAQDNPSARLDRQFVGRAARQGDPGSAETWFALDAVRSGVTPGADWMRSARRRADGSLISHTAFIHLWNRALQGRHRRLGMRLRRRLLEQDLAWQKQLDFERLRA